MDLKNIVTHFSISEEVVEIKPLGTGLINDTYLVRTSPAAAQDYVLQRINHAIFKDVELLQRNIQRITDHIRHKLQQANANDVDRKTLTLVAARDGQLFYFDGENYWRITRFIDGSKTYEQVTPEFAFLTGQAFGEFQYLLSDLGGEPLGATIPDFHNMEFRLHQLREAIGVNPVKRLAKVQAIVDELLLRAEDMCKAERLYREGKLPKRITHCDTKVNNMLFDEEDHFLCVIDLDTTMPGFVLSDFGDFIRTAANTGAEDDEDLSRVGVNMDIFKSFARGYLQSARPFLTTTEIENLPYGAQLLTYMQTVRFLTDYINGDTYYKIKYPDHNLQRTLAQLTLLHSIDAHLNEMNTFIKQFSNH
ncbi:MAG: aminoglycoside phosphotransferase family protein [Odoribacter sp.]